MKAMKLYLVFILSSYSVMYLTAQGVNHIQITPSDPTSSDTIYVISDFSYYGACEYGLVYSYSYSDDTSMHIAPTYCGYFLPDSTLCQSIDTFKIAPLQAGIYRLNIEYHQGSVCPISDFDAIIAEFDTSLVISSTQSTSGSENDASASILVYPNPASDFVTIHIGSFEKSEAHGFALRNAFGQVLFHHKINEPLTHLYVDGLKGVFILEIYERAGRSIVLRKIILQ